MTFFSKKACSFGLPERSTDNSTGRVHRRHTRSVHHEHHSLLTSTDHICACGSRLKSHCIIFVRMKRVCHQVSHVISLHVSLPVHHNTKHHLDSTTFSKTTLYTEHLFQNLKSRQAALMNRSRTSITRVAETRATPLPHVAINFGTGSGYSPEPASRRVCKPARCQPAFARPVPVNGSEEAEATA